MKRAQTKVRRILMLIDALSKLRMPFTVQDARHHLAERSGSNVEVCYRTIQRDLELLESIMIHLIKKELHCLVLKTSLYLTALGM